MSSQGDITRLIQNLSAGKKEAGEALFSLVYDELHALAGFYMRQERPDHTLQTTALVHEAYLRLGGESGIPWEDRAHFLRVAARSMRRVLIDYSRRRGSDKRSGGWHRVAIEEAVGFMEDPSTDVLDLDQAMSRLSALDTQMGQVAELHVFGGLSLEDTARILEVTHWTAKRDWRLARAWLKEDMGKGDIEI